MIIVTTLILLLSGCSAANSNAGNTPDNSSPNTNVGQGNQPPPTEPAPTEPAAEEPDSSNNVKEEEEEPAPAATAQEAAAAVISALKQSDMKTLSAYIHPEKGLLFSPYAHIETATAKVFPADGLPALIDSTVYNWGSYDGSGDPIDLTFKQYYDKFVYDKDFIEAETVGVDEIKGEGNTIVNIEDVFPNSYVMDYYFSGFDPQYNGMDWESLILVLEELNGAWYVSAIVHSQWTI
jgi:hypothetical protein